MRSPGRTARRLWVLAGLVWTAACAAIWWSLPVRPWAEWRLPEEGQLIGFLPGGRALVSAARTRPRTRQSDILVLSLREPVRVWEVPSGRCLREFRPQSIPFDVACLSRTGRWLALARRSRAEGPCLQLLRLADGALAEAPSGEARGVYRCFFGPDDRWLAFMTTDGDAARVALPGPPALGPTTPVGFAFALSTDGSAQAAAEGPDGGHGRLLVRDAQTLRLRGEVRLHPGHRVMDLLVSDGGAIVAALVRAGDDLRSPVEACCWRVDDGQLLVRVAGATMAVLGSDGRTLATIVTPPGPYAGHCRLSMWDVASGREVAAHSLEADYLSEPAVSPDGKTVAALVTSPAPDGLRDLAARLGLTWPRAEQDPEDAALFEAHTGRPLGRVRGDPSEARWSSDGSLLATLDRDELTVRVWHVPPRRPVSWLVAVAALFAIPGVLFARWCRRRPMSIL